MVFFLYYISIRKYTDGNQCIRDKPEGIHEDDGFCFVDDAIEYPDHIEYHTESKE